MTFTEYLTGKKIDSASFKASEPIKWEELSIYFLSSGSNNFDLAKKFIINPLRRMYHLKEEVEKVEPVKVAAASPATGGRKRPVMKR